MTNGREQCFKCKKEVPPKEDWIAYPLELKELANCVTWTCENCGNTMSISEIIDSDLIKSIKHLAEELK